MELPLSVTYVHLNYTDASFKLCEEYFCLTQKDLQLGSNKKASTICALFTVTKDLYLTPG